VGPRKGCYTPPRKMIAEEFDRRILFALSIAGKTRKRTETIPAMKVRELRWSILS
jgi:ribosomal protein S30